MIQHAAGQLSASVECQKCGYRWRTTIVYYADGERQLFPPCPCCEERRRYDAAMRRTAAGKPAKPPEQGPAEGVEG